MEPSYQSLLYAQAMTSAHGPKMPVPDHKTVAIHTLRQRLSDGVTTWRQHFSRAPGRGRLAGLYRRLSDTICRRCVGISWHSGMKTMAALRNFNLGILYLPKTMYVQEVFLIYND